MKMDRERGEMKFIYLRLETLVTKMNAIRKEFRFLFLTFPPQLNY